MDFFSWSKLIPMFLYPLPLFLIVILGFSFAIKSTGPRWTLRIITALLWLVSTPWFCDQALALWEYPRKSIANLGPKYDVGIVLGGLVNPLVSTKDHVEFGGAVERLTEAVDLYREGYLKALLLSSGSGELGRQDAPEAPLLKQWAEKSGVPDTALFVEDKSRNTEENAVFSERIAAAQKWKRVLLITSAEHMPRAAATFRQAGFGTQGNTLDLWPVDTRKSGRGLPFNLAPDPNSLAETQSLFKEAVGTLVYAIKGYLKLPLSP